MSGFFSPLPRPSTICIFFFNDTATTEIYTLSLHDALPISKGPAVQPALPHRPAAGGGRRPRPLLPQELRHPVRGRRSEEHTSELQSLAYLVCRLLLEKKKNKFYTADIIYTIISSTLAIRNN